MAKKTTKRREAEFFELVNWKKAQPRMKGANQPWMKLYTSLLDHEPFALIADCDRVLIIALWLYAARTGKYIFPADAKWLSLKIPMLNSRPKLKPLAEARDVYGNPAPFIRYCDPPRPAEEDPQEEAAEELPEEPGQGEQKKSEQKREEKRRGEQSRADENREDDTGAGEAVGKRVSARKKKTREGAKTKNSAEKSKSGKSRASKQKAAKRHTKATSAHKPQEHPRPEPEDPTNPDALGRSDVLTGTDAAPGSANTAAADRRHVRPMSAAVYDRCDIQFGRRVFLALRLPGDPDNGAVDETTSFASTWHKIRQGRDPPDEDALGRRLLKEAQSIARKRNVKNKAAAWNHVAVKIANAGAQR